MTTSHVSPPEMMVSQIKVVEGVQDPKIISQLLIISITFAEKFNLINNKFKYIVSSH